MKKINKNLLAFCLVFVFTAAGIFAQQITKFGVVDTSKVYSAYFRNSAPVCLLIQRIFQTMLSK